MKNSSTYERKWKAFLSQLRKAYTAAQAALPTPPTQELIWSVLLEDAPEGTAKVAMSRLTGHFLDLNELRVSRPDEIVEALPNTLGDAAARARRILRALQRIYDKFDRLEMDDLREQPKREARNFIARMPEMTPFVEGRVCQLGLNIHAMPVDATLVRLLAEHGVVHPQTDARDTQGFLERVVPSKDAVEITLLLETFRQEPGRIKPLARKPAARRPKPAAPRVAVKKRKATPAKRSGRK